MGLSRCGILLLLWRVLRREGSNTHRHSCSGGSLHLLALLDLLLMLLEALQGGVALEEESLLEFIHR